MTHVWGLLSNKLKDCSVSAQRATTLWNHKRMCSWLSLKYNFRHAWERCELHLHTFQQKGDLLNVTYVKPKDRRCFEQAAKPYGQFFLKTCFIIKFTFANGIIIHNTFLTCNKKNISETVREGVVLERELLHITLYMSYIKGQTLWSTNRLNSVLSLCLLRQGTLQKSCF